VRSVHAVPSLLFHAIIHHSTFTSINGTTTHGASFNVGTRGVVIHGIVVLVYGTLFCGSKRGQAIGMKVTGTRAVDVVTGAPIGYARAFGRALIEYVLALARSPARGAAERHFRARAEHHQGASQSAPIWCEIRWRGAIDGRSKAGTSPLVA